MSAVNELHIKQEQEKEKKAEKKEVESPEDKIIGSTSSPTDKAELTAAKTKGDFGIVKAKLDYSNAVAHDHKMLEEVNKAVTALDVAKHEGKTAISSNNKKEALVNLQEAKKDYEEAIKERAISKEKVLEA